MTPPKKVPIRSKKTAVDTPPIFFKSFFLLVYDIGIYVIRGLAHIAALFNHKIRAFVNGRKGLTTRLARALRHENKPIIWMHCASLGEFEQGRPVIEGLKATLPNYNILLTFLSPSGYEVCQHYKLADFVFYSPWDSAAQVRKFIDIVDPKFAIFIKYDFWFGVVRALHKKKIPLILVSALFRKSQLFFKSYGFFYRSLLYQYHHFFVQDRASLQQLHTIGIDNVTLAGDSRIDRVVQIAESHKRIPLVEQFKGQQEVFVAGSCWPEDLPLLLSFIHAQQGTLKFIIAPHEITESFLSKIESALTVKSIRYSEARGELSAYTVLLIDNVGLLSHLYQYGKCAYVGGSFGKGLHNILEPACHGKPVFFGNKNYKKFKEAIDLTASGAAFVVQHPMDLMTQYESLRDQSEKYAAASHAAKTYIAEHTGATKKIVAYCRHLMG